MGVLADSAVSTRKVKPTTINFKATSAVNHTINTTAYADVANTSFTYLSGATAERLFLWASCLFNATTGSSNWTINCNGVSSRDEAYTDNAPTSWQWSTVFDYFDIPANTTVTIKLQARVTGGGSGSVSFGGSGAGTATWKPRIFGFAVSNA